MSVPQADGEGYAAGKAGADKPCPYHDGTPERSAWLKAYKKGFEYAGWQDKDRPKWWGHNMAEHPLTPVVPDRRDALSKFHESYSDSKSIGDAGIAAMRRIQDSLQGKPTRTVLNALHDEMTKQIAALKSSGLPPEEQKRVESRYSSFVRPWI